MNHRDFNPSYYSTTDSEKQDSTERVNWPQIPHQTHVIRYGSSDPFQNSNGRQSHFSFPSSTTSSQLTGQLNNVFSEQNSGSYGTQLAQSNFLSSDPTRQFLSNPAIPKPPSAIAAPQYPASFPTKPQASENRNNVYPPAPVQPAQPRVRLAAPIKLIGTVDD